MLAEELAQEIESKKHSIYNAIEEFASSIRSTYANAFMELEQQNARLTKIKEQNTLEIKELLHDRHELTQSIALETDDHKKTIAHSKAKSLEIEGLKKELEFVRKKLITTTDLAESQSQELLHKNTLIETLQEQVSKLEEENELLNSKTNKLKDMVEKSTIAYAHAAKSMIQPISHIPDFTTEIKNV